MTPKINQLMEVWNARPKIQIVGDTGWDDFFLEPENATWAARFIIAMATASKDMALVNSGCITGSIPVVGMPGAFDKATCVFLLDGRKIVIGRHPETMGAAWLEIVPQATIQVPAIPVRGGSTPSNENQKAPVPAPASNSGNPGQPGQPVHTASTHGQTADTGNKPSAAKSGRAGAAAKARAAKAAKRAASSKPQGATPAALPPVSEQTTAGNVTV